MAASGPAARNGSSAAPSGRCSRLRIRGSRPRPSDCRPCGTGRWSPPATGYSARQSASGHGGARAHRSGPRSRRRRSPPRAHSARFACPPRPARGCRHRRPCPSSLRPCRHRCRRPAGRSTDHDRRRRMRWRNGVHGVHWAAAFPIADPRRSTTQPDPDPPITAHGQRCRRIRRQRCHRPCRCQD